VPSIIETGLASNLPSSCLHLLSARITGVPTTPSLISVYFKPFNYYTRLSHGVYINLIKDLNTVH
jgi:hypothetical protein